MQAARGKEDVRTTVDFLRAVRRAAPLVPEHLALLFELAGLEWQQERRRLTHVAICAAVAGFGAFMVVVVATGVILAVAWRSPWRALAVSLVLGFYVVLTVLAGFLARRLVSRESRAFADTRAELHRDLDLFRQAP